MVTVPRLWLFYVLGAWLLSNDFAWFGACIIQLGESEINAASQKTVFSPRKTTLGISSDEELELGDKGSWENYSNLLENVSNNLKFLKAR